MFTQFVIVTSLVSLIVVCIIATAYFWIQKYEFEKAAKEWYEKEIEKHNEEVKKYYKHIEDLKIAPKGCDKDLWVSIVNDFMMGCYGSRDMETVTRSNIYKEFKKDFDRLAAIKVEENYREGCRMSRSFEKESGMENAWFEIV